MARAYLEGQISPVILPHNFAQAAAVMAQFDRATLASTVEVLVNLIDVLDGDADAEDATNVEDDFTLTEHAAKGDGPGCIYSDPDKCVDDDGEAIDEREADPGEFDFPGRIAGGGSGDL